ncbi:MAG: hypothetical protein M3146_09710, partial [Thermoproteota archaeon]|nr:hypothetical protein [Thermoproteota archaeon]
FICSHNKIETVFLSYIRNDWFIKITVLYNNISKIVLFLIIPRLISRFQTLTPLLDYTVDPETPPLNKNSHYGIARG